MLGIKYESVTVDPDKPGCVFREACRLPGAWQHLELRYRAAEEGERRGTCEHFCLPTDAEIAEYEAMVAAHIEKVVITGNLVQKLKEEHKGKNWSGQVECPVCKGRLHVSIAGSFNGHAFVRCETTDCVSYRE